MQSSLDQEKIKSIQDYGVSKILDFRHPEIPRLTLVVCCYQQSLFLEDALNRAHQIQSVLSTELIFIDDGSLDGSFDLAVNWQQRENASILLIAKNNQGLVHSLNMALDLTRSTYVFFISADDLICTEELLILFRSIESNPKLDFAMGNSICFGVAINHRPVYGKVHKRFLLSPAKKRSSSLPSRLPGTLLIQATLFKTDFLRFNNGWDSNIRLDDLQLFVKIFSMKPEPGINFIYMHELYVSEYRQHLNNSHKRLLYQFSLYEEYIRKSLIGQVRNSEYAFGLAMYIIQALLTKNTDALKTLIKFAQKEKIVFLTMLKLVKRIFYKVYSLTTNEFGEDLHRTSTLSIQKK